MVKKRSDGFLAHRTDESLDQCSDHCTDPQSSQCGEGKEKTDGLLAHHTDESLDQCSDHCTDLRTHQCAARKWKNVVVIVFFVPQQQGTKSCKEEIIKETPYSLLFRNLRRNPILGTQTFLT